MFTSSTPAPAKRVLKHAGLLVLTTIALMLLASCVGADGWQWVGAKLNDEITRQIVLEIRGPRIVGAWLAGALLGLAGGIAQGLFRNPLADPYLLGSATGAALFAALFMVLAAWAMHSNWHLELNWLLRLGVTGAAFVGALLSVMLTVLLAGGAANGLRLLLAGVIVGVVLGAITSLLMLLQPQIMRNMQGFMLGNTAFIGWQSCAILLLAFIPCTLAACLGARGLDALALGESTASSLGLDLKHFRLFYILLMALATGAAVAQSGLIAFVGLAAPHLARTLFSASYRLLLPFSVLLGGLLLLAADLLARSIIIPQELPVGVLTAIIGGIYLLYLMHKKSMQGGDGL